jgi:heme exporter protein D
MQFSSVADFLNMGGYAFYVWLSYGASTALIIYLLFASVNRHKSVLQQIAQRQKREQKLRQAAEKNMNDQQMSQSEVNDDIIEKAVAQATSEATSNLKSVEN